MIKNGDNKSKGPYFYPHWILAIIFGVLLFFYSYFFSGFADDLRGNPHSITLMFLLFGIVGLCLFLFFRRNIYGIKNHEVSGKTARFYYEQGMGLIKSALSAFILTLVILWGFVLSRNVSKSVQILTAQGEVLFYLVGYVLLFYYLSLVIDFRDAILKAK
ncbi:hypothetical protein KJA15_02050 [Patescibacteria group bacterium]|nr:hypothetical protein [Patescibacteria group bacterium]